MQGMLETHNQTRAAVGVAPLVWSSRMSQYAQQWAEHLATQNNCQMQHRSAAGANTLLVGENIYWASPVTWSDGRTEVQTITPSQVALDWASEKADYNVASNTCRTGASCGHYTQMVWNTTAEVGCGMSICPDKGQIWVCNYNPPGNWVGEKPY
jgi:pathogenesis-related protein 1